MTRGQAKNSLPTLDLRRFDAGDDERRRFLADLRDAARTYGFFYLVGHGVEDSLIQSVLALSRRSLPCPNAEKLEIEMINSPHFRGYTRAGLRIHPRAAGLARTGRHRRRTARAAARSALAAVEAAARARTNGPPRFPN